jgi:hypothetical protein
VARDLLGGYFMTTLRSLSGLAVIAIAATACTSSEPQTNPPSTAAEHFEAQQPLNPVDDTKVDPAGDPEVDVVAAPPPAPRVEVVPRPVVGRVWVPGYWWWGGRRGYVWMGGRYAVAPRGAVWEGPRYVFRGGVHYYYRPHWVRRW